MSRDRTYEVDGVTGGLVDSGTGEPLRAVSGLNPGITKTVAMLREHGFNTTDSGDGETHEHACDREVSYVSIVVENGRMLTSECHRLAGILLEHMTEEGRQALGPMGEGEVAIQGSYDPMNLTAIIDVTGIHDRMLREKT